MKQNTIRDVAKLACVSTATVSRVINGNPSVAQEYVTRVNKAISELNFRPNAAAQQIHQKRTGNVGLILPNTTDPFFGNTAHNIIAAAANYGQNVIITTSQSGLSYDESACYKKMASAAIDGLIFCSVAEVNQSELEHYLGDIPLVVCSRHNLLTGKPHVYFNHRKGGYLATKHLLELGHNHIALLVGCFGNMFHNVSDLDKFLENPVLAGPYTGIDKYVGAREALAEKNVPFRPELVEFIDMGDPYRSGYEAMQRLISKTTKVEAVFCCNDFSASGAIHMLASQNIDVPKMISVIGYDNGILATCTQPQLSTVIQDTSVLGTECVRSLNALINNEFCDDTLIDVQLVIRYSSCYRKTPETPS